MVKNDLKWFDKLSRLTEWFLHGIIFGLTASLLSLLHLNVGVYSSFTCCFTNFSFKTDLGIIIDLDIIQGNIFDDLLK